jgi:hypothetical protein
MNVTSQAEGSAGARTWNSFAWVLVLLGVFFGQGWKTLQLFGTENPWQALLNDEPITSGRHALHLYHGYLGAQSFRERGTLCCYDPAFQAGYPKTPVFDGGSRPAELFLSVAGSRYRPAAYKVGMAICSCLAPLLLWLAARGLAFGPGAACIVALVGSLISWSTPGRRLLIDGDLDTILAGLAAVLQCSMMLSFHRQPTLFAWLGLAVASCLGWFADPVLFLLLSPLLLVHVGSVGTRHSLPWHGALLSGLASGIVANLFWLMTWFTNWWIRVPLNLSAPLLLAHRTPRTVWDAALWGNESERLLIMLLLVGATVGVAILNQSRQRAAARLFGSASLGLTALVIASVSCEPVGWLGTGRLLVPALWFALLPATYTLATAGRGLMMYTGSPWRAWLLAATALAAIALAGPGPIGRLVAEYIHAEPLRVGLGERDAAIVGAIAQKTTSAGRILWEDLSAEENTGRFSPLLPLLTQRAFIGGIDPECAIEHGYASLVDSRLASRALANWTDAELAGFCRTYNIGWVVCRSAASASRFTRWKDAISLNDTQSTAGIWIYQLPEHSFALVGQANLLKADQTAITLTDVVPENGQVILSLHYQTGMRASPSRVQIERATDADDPIPFVRLRLSNPVARLTLSWTPH